MAELPPVRPEKPAEPAAAGTRPALSVIDIVSYLCALSAVITLAVWGFTAWEAPWNILIGVSAPVVTVLLWALFVSPRAVIAVHPFVRALIELLIYVSATIVWWSAGQALIGLTFAIVAVTAGLVTGRRRLP